MFKLKNFTVQEVTVTATMPPSINVIGLPEWWQYGYTGKNVVVAVLDTGVDINHPDLKDKIIGCASFIPGEPDCNDLNGHGTHVAGIIAAKGQMTGGAPDAKILAVKVLGAQGQGSVESVIAGLEYCLNWRGPNGEKVNVINMSLGAPEDDPRLHEAVKKLYQAGIPIIVAAGNEGDGNLNTQEIDYPAAYPETICIGAVDLAGRVATFSNTNYEVDAAAPGVDIISTYKGSCYAKLSGTSMAAPHASAYVACLIDRFLSKTKRLPNIEEVRILLIVNSLDLEKNGFDPGTGYGIISCTNKLGL